MATYYLNPSATGANNGGAGNDAWQSWSDAITGINTNNPDMVTATEGVHVWVLGSLGSVSADVTMTSLCSPAYPLVFEADPSVANPGVFSASNPGISFSGAKRFLLGEVTGSQYVEFRGLTFFVDGMPVNIMTARAAATYAAGSGFVFDGCYIRAGQVQTGTSNSTAISTRFANFDLTVRNCVFDQWAVSNTGRRPMFSTQSGSDNLVVNSTFVNVDALCDSLLAADIRLVNCILVDTATNVAGTTAGFLAASGKNASNAATGLPGSDNTYDIDDTTLFVSSTDRHLAAANTWGAGPSDGTYGSYVPTTDIDGDTRSGATTSAGADEVVAASGPTPPYVSVSIS